MAQYSIDFSTNALKVVRSIEELNQEIATLARTGKSIKINLDTTQLNQQIGTTFKKLDKEIARYQRQLRKLQIGSPEFISRAGEIGQRQGVRERGRMQAEAASLRQEAFAFESGSAVALQKLLRSLRIEAQQIKPDTQEWVRLQQRIAQVNNDLKKGERLAESIQLTEDLNAFSPQSLNALEAKLTILRNRAREIAPNTTEWKELNKEIVKAEQNIEKQTRRPLTRGQRLGAAGGAFLYGGGLGGGIGSAVGGIAGGLAGGVPAAFAGAAIGQAVDNLGAMAFAMNDQANAIRRLRLGLASASTDLNDFAQANQLVADISDRLLIPIGEVYGQFTRLRASTVALGIDTKTTGEVFEGVSIAVLKSGGSMEDVSGAMRAVSQVFSKGKVTAEELRGQLGERLPGAVVKFAQKNRIALQDLDKAFEQGRVSVDQFVTFAKGLLKEGEGYSDALANNQEYASARYAKAVEKMQLAIGKAVGPMLNSIQDFAAESITSILWLSGELEKFAQYMEKRFGGGRADSVFLGQGARNIADRIIGGDVEVKELEDRMRFYRSKIRESQAIFKQIQEGKYKDQRNIFEMMFGGPGEENLRKNLPNQIAYYTKQLQELAKARKLAEEATKGESALVAGEGDPEADKKASALLAAIERREEALANARENYEREVASVRKNAIKQAEALERRYQDQRLQSEREIGRARRNLAAAAQEEGLLRRGIAGEDPALLEQERKIGETIRQYTEEKISREEEAQDRQIGLARELEDFKRQNADAINKANERYANAIGKIQQEYAKSVAKLIEDGSGAGAKKLAAAGKLIAAQIARASAQQAFVSATGAAIVPRGQGMYEVAGRQMTEAALLAAAEKSAPATKTAAKSFVDATKEIEKAQKDLNASMKLTAQSTAVSLARVSTADIEGSIQSRQRSLAQSLSALNSARDQLGKKEAYNQLLNILGDATRETSSATREINTQNDAIKNQIDLITNGTLPALAEEASARQTLFDQQSKLLSNAIKTLNSSEAGQALLRDEPGLHAGIIKELQKELDLTVQQKQAYAELQQTLRDNAALLETAQIESATSRVGIGLRAGFINEAAVAYEEQIGKGVSPEIAANIARATEKMMIAKTTAESLQGAINGIGSAFGEAMTTGVASLVSGTATAKEVFASFLQSVAQALSQAAAQMIATYIAIGIAKIFAGLGSAASVSATGPNPGGIPSTGNVTAPSVNGVDLGAAANIAANGAYFNGGMSYFATGGIVSSPTFFQFADGGKINMGLMGEAGPEAIMPLKRGPDGKLGVSLYNDSRRAVANAENNAGISSIDYEDSLSTGGASTSRQSLSSKAAQAVMETRTQVMEQRSYSEKRSEMRQIEEMVARPAKIDVEYQSQVINNVEYVTREQAERMASQSALRGRELAIGALQNSVKARKRVGMA